MKEEKRIITLEKRVKHLHEVFNLETDATDKNIESIVESMNTIVDSINNINKFMVDIQTYLVERFENDEEDEDEDEEEDGDGTTPPGFKIEHVDEINRSYQ